MLSLGRKTGEMITIECPDGQTIVIKITEQRQGRVQLGFSAPQAYRILRNELLPEPEPIETEPTLLVNPDWVRDAQEARRMKC